MPSTHSTPRWFRRCPLLAALGLFAGSLLPLRGASGAVSYESPGQAKPQRKPPATLASLPAPQATGPLRILLVDDDASANNHGSAQEEPGSDTIFRELVRGAVGGRSDAWKVDVVKARRAGSTFEELRPFNVIVWYTGAAYGAEYDTLGRDDEGALRRYLEQVGGSVILISPGYVNNVVYGQKWDSADHPFLKEVMAVNGCYGLALRFASATVEGYEGSLFQVAHPGIVETQFSTLNPDGAAIVFSSPLRSTTGREVSGSFPVAVANAYGRGRIVYVGFSLENIPEADRTRAFEVILGAAGVRAEPATGRTNLAPAADNAVTDAPQRFSVIGSTSTMFTFSTSQPGPVRLAVQYQGVPITVTVHHPDGRRVEHAGVGALSPQDQVRFTLADQVLAADVARGHVWGVSVRATQATAQTGVVASGAITVTHPPVDAAAAKSQRDRDTARAAALAPKTVTVIEAPSPTLLREIAKRAAPPAPARIQPTALVTAKQPVKAMLPPPPAPPQTVGGTSAGMVPGIAATTQFAGTPPVAWYSMQKGAKAGDTLKVWGRALFPPGTPAKKVMDEPGSFSAELHIAWAGFNYVVPMKAWEVTTGGWYHGDETEEPKNPTYTRGFECTLPDIGVLDTSPASVYVKTMDGRVSPTDTITFEPIRTTATLGMPIVNGRLVDSKLADCYSNADLTRNTIARNTVLFGYEGDDEFYLTTQLKNGWKVTSVELKMGEHFGGASLTDSRIGTQFLYAKVHWHIIYVFPGFTETDFVDYELVYHLSGPAGQPFL